MWYVDENCIFTVFVWLKCYVSMFSPYAKKLSISCFSIYGNCTGILINGDCIEIRKTHNQKCFIIDIWSNFAEPNPLSFILNISWRFRLHNFFCWICIDWVSIWIVKFQSFFLRISIFLLTEMKLCVFRSKMQIFVRERKNRFNFFKYHIISKSLMRQNDHQQKQ